MIAAIRERYLDCKFVVNPCTPLGFEDASIDVITVTCQYGGNPDNMTGGLHSH